MKTLDRALLVAVNINDVYLTEKSINELAELAKAVGIKTVDKIVQNLPRVNPRYYVGFDKLNEIKNILNALQIDILITDDTLSPTQLRNLENHLDVQVIDRSFLILQIFAQRAKTRQAILEVSLAMKQYMLPRLLGMGQVLSRQGGGTFNAKGPGETKLELDRRRLSQEIYAIKQQIKIIKIQRDITVKKRQNNEIPVVALVGYTNAGKSSLMNYFIKHYGCDKSPVFEENMLFATLDTKAKLVKKPGSSSFILVDTVGFIAKLPNELIASFQSTLNDIITADLIIHIVDGLDVDPAKIDFVKAILHKLKMDSIPRITVVSKGDLKEIPISELGDHAYQISSKTGKNIDSLMAEIESIIFANHQLVALLLPYSKGEIFSFLKDNTTVIKHEFVAEGIKLTCLLSPKLVAALKPFIIK